MQKIVLNVDKGVKVRMTKVLLLSGYKPYELGIFKKDHQAVRYIKAAIRKELEPLVEDGLEWVIISGQLGVELWGAEVVFELKQQNPQLKLAVITPFLEQEENWNELNKEWYYSIINQADFFDSVTKKKYEKPWQFRLKNQFLLDKSDVLVLLYDSEKEGSPKYLYEMALQHKDKQAIRLIDFQMLHSIVEEENFETNGF